MAAAGGSEGGWVEVLAEVLAESGEVVLVWCTVVGKGEGLL